MASSGISSRWARRRNEKDATAAPIGVETDLQLVRRIQTGDTAAFSDLYDRYAAQVHGLCRMVLRDDRLAEEATHDVFLGFLQNPGMFDASRGGFGGWLLRVARNRSIDLLRKRREHPFASMGTTDDGGEIDPLANIADPELDPSDQVLMTMMGRDVRRALNELTSDHRTLLEMAYFGGMTQREIADTLNRPLGTVKTQIRTAMQRMAKLLSPGNAPEPRRSAFPSGPSIVPTTGDEGEVIR